MRQIALINHGCAKNLVDSELMLGKLAQNGYKITLDETKADIVIINTCSFINDAEKESEKPTNFHGKNRLWIKRNFFNMIKDTYEKPRTKSYSIMKN